MCPHEFSRLTTARFVHFVGVSLTLDLLKTINFSTMGTNVSKHARFSQFPLVYKIFQHRDIESNKNICKKMSSIFCDILANCIVHTKNTKNREYERMHEKSIQCWKLRSIASVTAKLSNLKNMFCVKLYVIKNNYTTCRRLQIKSANRSIQKYIRKSMVEKCQ